MVTSSVAVAATFSCEPLGRWLAFWLERIGLDPSYAFAGYGQLEHELRRPQVLSGARASVGLLRFADWQRDASAFDAERFESDLALFEKSVQAALSHLPRLLLLVCPSRPSAQAATFACAAARLRHLAEEQPRLTVVDVHEVAGAYAVAEPHDVLADQLGHLPYTEPMWCAIGAAVTRAALPALAPPLKVIVVDCDYTLWDGAVGESGAAVVRCEPRHLELQERLLALKARGVLLALCSRNEPHDVWAVLDRQGCAGAPVLSRGDVSAHRIAPELNKGTAVASICDELRASPDTVLFVDDNPAECHAVRAALPTATVWCWPQTHAEAREQLRHVWRLDLSATAASSGAEDSGLRASSVAADAQSALLRTESSSLTEYLSQLRVQVAIDSAVEAELERVGLVHQLRAYSPAEPPDPRRPIPATRPPPPNLTPLVPRTPPSPSSLRISAAPIPTGAGAAAT